MRLDLRFTPRPPYAIWCEAVVGFVHERSFIVEENMAGVDTKTSAYLRTLNQEGFYAAKVGETLLLPGEERLRAEKVLIKGLGAPDNITSILFLNQVADVALTLSLLGICNFAAKIPLLFGPEQYADQVRMAVQEMMRPFLAKFHGQDGLVITAVFSVERPFLEDAKKVEAPLRDYFESLVPFSLVTESGVNHNRT